MIRVLIVDDDNLSRKGLISLLPWEEYDMEVCGEASNGKKALEFLLNNEIELLVTDLEMPVMSGLELIGKVKERYPEIEVVVLSMHEEFSLVQQSYRSGILDYIAKNELEKKQLGTVLGRIKSKMDSRISHRETSLQYRSSDYLAIYNYGDEVFAFSEDPVRLVSDFHIVKIDSALWIIQMETGQNIREIAFRLGRNLQRMAVIQLLQLEGLKPSVFHKLLGDYCRHGFFYDYMEGESYFTLTFQDLCRKETEPNLDALTNVEKCIISLNWLYSDDIFSTLISDIEGLRIPPSLLKYFISRMKEYWKIYKEGYVNDWELDNSNFTTWAMMKCHLEGIRAREEVERHFLGITGEVAMAMAMAFRLIKEEYSQAISAEYVASRVNLSRSYFNELFKKVYNSSFLELLTNVRMDRAGELLITTELSIGEIAPMVGYQDEKYFSRLFQKNRGKRPSEFRKSRNDD